MNINQPWILFPEIIGATIVAIYSPFYLAKMFFAGHVLLSLLGGIGWLAGAATTAWCLKQRLYMAAFWPMFIVLGVGLLIHHTLF